MTNRVRDMTDASRVCPGCASMRALVERLVTVGIDWLDACDAPEADLEDNETEIISSDDGVVAARILDLEI